MVHGRDYHGSPLDYYREVYGKAKLSRWELARNDEGLYRALIRHHELDLAIPEVKQGYQKGHAGRHGPSPGIINDVLEAHETFGASATEAEKHLPVCDKTIIKTWRAHGLPILKSKPRQNINYRH